MMKKFLIVIFLIFTIFMVGCSNNKDVITPLPDDPGIDNGETKPEIDDKDIIEYIRTKVLLLDIKNNYIELANTKANKLTPNTKVYKKIGEEVVDASLDDLFIGMENIYVKTKGKEEVSQILIDGDPIFNNIRVAIRNSIDDIADINTLTHDSITIHVMNDTIIKKYDGSKTYSVKAHTYLNFIIKDGFICCYNNKVLIKSDKRLIIQGGSKELTVSSINRAVGAPSYSGNLEISIHNNKLLLTNDVSMEEYLRKVVPSEMPASWNMSALEAQAVAARTYAYREIFNKTYMNLGYVVDDSTSSQVYNNGSIKDSTDSAVLKTKGITMFNNNEPIVAYYYSAGCGLKASGNEVWIKNKVIDEIPYLIGGNISNTEVDTSNEGSMLSFFKNLHVVAPSVNSSRFRWMISFTKEQLRNTLNKNIKMMQPNNKECYPILKNGKFEVGTFPEDIGEIINIKVAERGKSGVVISLLVQAKNVTFRIYNQYNIRFTVRPRDGGSTVVGKSTQGGIGYYSNNINNSSILPSGFFALEWVNDTLTFYGGGNGHGVGMDQYGAQYLASLSKTYREILTTYYTNITFVDTSVEYTELADYIKYFK